MAGTEDYTKIMILKAQGPDGLVTVGCTDDGYIKLLMYCTDPDGVKVPVLCTAQGAIRTKPLVD